MVETAADKQKRLIQQEIAKLSGAISRHGHGGPSRPTTYPTSQRNHPYPTRGAPRGRGATRGRGRGGSYALDLRQSKPAIVKAATPVVASTSREDGEVSPEPPAFSSSVVSNRKGKEKEATPVEKESWVKKTSKGGNMSLMTVQKSNVLASKPRLPRQPKVPPQIQVLSSTSGPSGPNRVVIDGVIFQFEEGGSKLTRIGELSPDTTSPRGTPTRKSVAYAGQKYRRTSKGNLVSSDRRTSTTKLPCRYFTKTGRCNRALTCTFSHDPTRVAICPKFLRSNCPNTASSCPLSHIPSPHNTPSCIHFQATAACRNGDACIYPHVKVADASPVCELFARGGWCDQEAGTCPELHVWECGEWRSKGVCSKGGKCGLQHVLRAENGRGSAVEAEKDGLGSDQELITDTEGARRQVPVEGGFEEQNEFIEFDHGTPADPESESESEHEASGSGSEQDEEEDEENEEDGDEDEDEEMSDITETGKPSRQSSPDEVHVQGEGEGQDDDDDEVEVLGIVM